MLSMFRFRRRYTVFLVFAAFITILVFRYPHTDNWGQDERTGALDVPSTPKDAGHEAPVPPKLPPPKALGEKPKEDEKPKGKKPIEEKKPSDAHTEPILPAQAETTKENPTKPPSTIPDVIPQKAHPPSPHDAAKHGGVEEDIHPVAPPGRQDFPTFTATPNVIHWEKQTEKFSVPTESIIKLPTGAPVSIPQIQYSFKDETPDAKIIRERRQSQVKKEFKKAWEGYKNQAWLHDELSPVTGGFRDPFCGWAATLVDSLDTLWIMGLEEEFEEAAKAVDKIDFTTSPRNDIPLFETTIRYLGGLVGAYDVSGRKYKNLLSKAEELAEILIGAFDTPNRMPVLFYQWKPAFASQPHRASQRSNLAELGSLSLEFTRLAQLTKEPRYYDAVARITNALAEFQNRTKLPGVFPPDVDATGCNRTEVAAPVSSEGQPEGYEPSDHKAATESSPKETEKKETSDTSEKDSKDFERAVGRSKERKVSLEGQDVKGLSKREITPTNPISGLPVDLPKAKAQIGELLGDWDCREQGLESSRLTGTDRFSMGGGQDSTYEYFPKQYLLLGGRVDMYRQLYLNTIEAIRKYMLFRPMVPGSRDILFAGSFVTDGRLETPGVFTAEIDHLTCFIGGMVGMAAKIFDIENDLDIAKKLADGCVWAYGSMPSDIMAESAVLMPCESMENCVWNETAYHNFLDPSGADRDRRVEEYLAKKAAEKEDNERKAAEKEAKDLADAAKGMDETAAKGMDETVAKGMDETVAKGTDETVAKGTDEIAAKGMDETVAKGTDEITAKGTDETAAEGAGKAAAKIKDQSAAKIQADSEKPKDEARRIPNPAVPSVQKRAPPPRAGAADPQKPLSHKEWVQDHIHAYGLPAGYVNVKSKSYILRPEAIESVWYMYRITGDPAWQAKGWKMFEAVIQATSAEYGHSAIRDVTSSEPALIDQMESFWLAETLKYFYLLFSTPDTISLDEWVLNTEAHPFKREV